MILSGKEIEKRVGSDILIEPYTAERLNPNSYNLRLDNKLAVYKSRVLDMKCENEIEYIEIPEEGLVLQPNTLYLGRTYERTVTKNLVPMLEGRSSVGRLGIAIHVTAGFGDVGFDGFWTLEIFCLQPVRIYPFVDIGQIYYHTIEGSYEEYGKSGKYQGNNGIQGSQMYKDFLNKE